MWDFYMSMLTLLEKIRQLRDGEIDRETLNHWAEQEGAWGDTGENEDGVSLEAIMAGYIRRMISTIPEQAYSDEKLFAVLEGRVTEPVHLIYAMPPFACRRKDRVLIDLARRAVENVENDVLFQREDRCCPSHVTPIPFHVPEDDRRLTYQIEAEYNDFDGTASSDNLNDIIAYNIIKLLRPIVPGRAGIAISGCADRTNKAALCQKIRQLCAYLAGEEPMFLSLFYCGGRLTVSVM